MAIAGRTHLGPYRLIRQIRAGQSCQIWQAVNEANERVALKILKDEFRKNRYEVGQLRREFLIGQDFDHPNVIKVHEFNIIDKIPFLAVEYCGPRNVKQAIQDGVADFL